MDMKLIPLSMPVVILGALVQVACASEQILDVHANREMTRKELIEKIGKADELIVGEKHYTKSIQRAEARLFRDYARERGEAVTFAWEFWDWRDEAKLQDAYRKFRSYEIKSDEFLKTLFGEKNYNPTYAPLLKAVRDAGADVLAVNLSRAEKTPVIKGGISALDPKLLPAGFEMGGKDYYDRFVLAMEGHGDPATYPNYFAAQSLVDDVIAFHIDRDRPTRSLFLLIGEFHTSYFDGVWKRASLRSRESRLRYLIQIANRGDHSDWDPILHHPKYGDLADFVIFIR